MKQALVFLFFLLAGCASDLPPQATEVVVFRLTSTPQVVVVTPAPDQKADPMQAAAVRPSPTLRSRPSYCYQDPMAYLDEVDRTLEALADAVGDWNQSPRGEAELLEVEVRVRTLLDQAEKLQPPADFAPAHEHFIKALQINLYAIFSITDRSADRLEGTNVSFQEEFQRMRESWQEAYEHRSEVCQ